MEYLRLKYNIRNSDGNVFILFKAESGFYFNREWKDGLA